MAEVLAAPLEEAGYTAAELGDDFDLLESGVIDSLGLIELIEAVNERFGVEVDFDQVDPAELTVVGPFCAFVAAKAEPPAEGREGSLRVSS